MATVAAAASSKAMTAIPVTLLTGFLGSGKTTLLSDILRDPRFANTAVIVNEFGELGLDNLLVERSLPEGAEDEMLEMTSGCLCCTIRGDIRESLRRLQKRRLAGEIPAFERLVIETTGLADPAPVIHTLMAERHFDLAAVVTLVDCVNNSRTLARQPEAMKQIAMADVLLVSKSDLARDPASRKDLSRLMTSLRRLNPGAAIHDRNDGAFDPARLFGGTRYNPAGKGAEVADWLRAEAFRSAEMKAHAHSHDHRHDDDVNRHGEEIQAFALIFDAPMERMAFTFALKFLVANQGSDLLRVKGIVAFKDAPERPVVLHGVQHIYHDPRQLNSWPDDDRRSKLVFITRGISRATVEGFFAAWQELEEEPLPAGSRGAQI